MINSALSAFDSVISSKCYISRYARLAQTVKTGTKRHPIACEPFNDCIAPDNDLLPNSDLKGVAFWKQVEAIKYEKSNVAPGKNIRHASVLLDLVIWVNTKKVTGDESGACTKPDLLIMDMVRSLDCLAEHLSTGLDYLSKVTVEVINPGNMVSWRQAMAEYDLSEHYALTMWPYYGFTIRVKLSWFVMSHCAPAFTCYTCSEEFTVTATPEAENICLGGSVVITAEVVGASGAAYQWQELIDDVWTDIDGAINVTYEAEESEPEAAHSYRVIATICEGCTATSEAVIVTFHDQPEVFIATEDNTIAPDEGTTITSEVIAGFGSNEYQWQHHNGTAWVNIGGATGTEYSFFGSDYGAGEHQFRVVVTQELNCGATSEPLTVTVTE